MRIPHFNEFGVLPFIHTDTVGDGEMRSPYNTGILAFCKRFGTSLERCQILDGFLKFRAALVEKEIFGFQWVNGSFVSLVEALEDRSPNDIDVVTFAPLGKEERQFALCNNHPELVVPQRTKETYRVDNHFIENDMPLDAEMARDIAFWYSLWSSQRNSDSWKGFVCIELPDQDNEQAARGWLMEKMRELSGAAKQERDNEEGCQEAGDTA